MWRSINGRRPPSPTPLHNCPGFSHDTAVQVCQKPCTLLNPCLRLVAPGSADALRPSQRERVPQKKASIAVGPAHRRWRSQNTHASTAVHKCPLTIGNHGLNYAFRRHPATTHAGMMRRTSVLRRRNSAVSRRRCFCIAELSGTPPLLREDHRRRSL